MLRLDPARIPRPHPVLLLGAAMFAAMTVFVMNSRLQVQLDAYLHDDSFYYLQTARNFALGRGSTFDGINYTNGYQPAWFAILAAMYWSGVSHGQAVATAIGIQATLFALGSLVLAMALTAAGISALMAASAVCVVYFGLVPILGWNLMDGGVAHLTSASVLWALVKLQGPGISPLLLGIVLSVAVLARTDHIFYLPIGATLLFWRIWHGKAERQIERVAAFLAPVVVVVGSYLLLNLFTTGHLMPVSGRVKANEPAATLAEFWSELARIDIRQTWKVGLACAIVLVFRSLWQQRIGGVAAYAAGGLSIFAFYQLAFGNGTMGFVWYFIPLYAMSCYALALGLQTASDWLLRGKPRASAIVMGAIVVAVLGARGVAIERYQYRADREHADTYSVALALREITGDRDVRIGAWDAGILGYYGGRVTNLDGLINSADFFERYYLPGRVIDYIYEVGFDYIVCPEHDLPDVLLGNYKIVFQNHSWVILENVAASGRARPDSAQDRSRNHT